MNTAPILASGTSFEGTETRVSETVKRVNAKALDLLNRQTEINRRIRYLRQVMRGLQDLKGRPALNRPTTSVQSVGPVAPVRRNHRADGLTRACRIALMEVAGAASLEEIRSRIIRRGSFSFADFGFANAAMIRTLNTMTDNGEIRCLENGPECRWQRVTPDDKGDSSQTAIQPQPDKASSNLQRSAIHVG